MRDPCCFFLKKWIHAGWGSNDGERGVRDWNPCRTAGPREVTMEGKRTTGKRRCRRYTYVWGQIGEGICLVREAPLCRAKQTVARHNRYKNSICGSCTDLETSAIDGIKHSCPVRCRRETFTRTGTDGTPSSLCGSIRRKTLLPLPVVLVLVSF